MSEGNVPGNVKLLYWVVFAMLVMFAPARPPSAGATPTSCSPGCTIHTPPASQESNPELNQESTFPRWKGGVFLLNEPSAIEFAIEFFPVAADDKVEMAVADLSYSAQDYPIDWQTGATEEHVRIEETWSGEIRYTNPEQVTPANQVRLSVLLHLRLTLRIPGGNPPVSQSKAPLVFLRTPGPLQAGGTGRDIINGERGTQSKVGANKDGNGTISVNTDNSATKNGRLGVRTSFVEDGIRCFTTP